jgi:hypothetical protein
VDAVGWRKDAQKVQTGGPAVQRLTKAEQARLAELLKQAG